MCNFFGISDQIDHNSTGYLFPAGNITLLAESIKKLYSDDNLIIKMGKNAEIKAKTIHSPDRYYKKTMKIFTKLVSDKN